MGIFPPLHIGLTGWILFISVFLFEASAYCSGVCGGRAQLFLIHEVRIYGSPLTRPIMHVVCEHAVTMPALCSHNISSEEVGCVLCVHPRHSIFLYSYDYIYTGRLSCWPVSINSEFPRDHYMNDMLSSYGTERSEILEEPNFKGVGVTQRVNLSSLFNSGGVY